METAMQQLRQMINDKISECATESRKYTFIQVLELIDISELIEQEQIHKSFDHGFQASIDSRGGYFVISDGEEYYNEKFNND